MCKHLQNFEVIPYRFCFLSVEMKWFDGWSKFCMCLVYGNACDSNLGPQESKDGTWVRLCEFSEML